MQHNVAEERPPGWNMAIPSFCPSAIPVQEANDRIVVGKMGQLFQEFRSRFGLFGRSELLLFSTSRCGIDV
jgi:hypothetical protein